MSDSDGLSQSYSGPVLNPETGEWSDNLPEEVKERDELDHDLDIYFLCCEYFGTFIPWHDFRAFPRPVLLRITSRIQEKLGDLDDSDSMPPLPAFFVMLAISRCFGSKS